MSAADCCPKDCNHETFEYCGTSGTHCDKHCCCPCRLCADERKREDSKKVTT